MLPDRASNPGPLTYESDALPIVLRGPAVGQGPIAVAVGAGGGVWNFSLLFIFSSSFFLWDGPI